MQVSPYASPPPSYPCAICASTQGTTVKQFTKTYTPRWVYFMIVAGALPAALVALVVQTRHQLHAPFCSRCSFKRSLAPVVSLLSAVAAIVTIIVGIAIGVSMSSWILGICGVLVAVGIAVFAGWYEKSANPKYIKVDAKNVVIDDPTHGPIVLVAPPSYPY